MKYLSLLIILFSINSFSEDYKSANRLQEGDVISADVFNDILDRIELILKSATAADLVGTWDVVQTICSLGGLGNCGDLSVTGTGTAIDSLYRQRSDVVTFTDDGDGTYSFQTTSFCAFVRSGAGNSACSGRYAVLDGRFILNPSGNQDDFVAYTLRKVSDTRIVLGINAIGSGSFNIIRLDKKNLAPNPPTALTASLSSGTVSLSWTASEGGATSYTIKAKTSATGTYSDVTTGNTSTTYSDSLSTGTKWYRIFAVNSDGTSIGSNVVSVTAP